MLVARARDEAEDAVGNFLQHVERQGTVDRAEVNAVGDSAIDAGATSYLISKSTALQTQRRLHDEAFVLIAKCLDLENQASNAAALLECQACYEQGLAKFSEAFSLRFTQEENVVARLLSEKMQRTNLMVAERLRMLQRQSTRAPRSVLASVELHPEVIRVEADPFVNLFSPKDFAAWVGESIPLVELIQSEFDRLGGHFGFQAGNVLNQREHLTMLCMNAMMRTSRYPGESRENVGVSAFKVLVWTEAVKHLHKKILDNYVHWCKFLMTPIHSFLTGHAPSDDPAKAHSARVRDIALYLLIWGEAANLRHCPECLCFLFHQMIQEAHAVSQGARPPPSTGGARPCFLEDTVTPLVTAISKESKRVKTNGEQIAHTERRNYDDFNEFFWHNRCLAFGYREGTQQLRGKIAPHVVSAFKTMPKSYLERRTWLHPLRAFYPVTVVLVLMLNLLIIFGIQTQKKRLIFSVEIGTLVLYSTVVITKGALALLGEVLGFFIGVGDVTTTIGYFLRMFYHLVWLAALLYFLITQAIPYLPQDTARTPAPTSTPAPTRGLGFIRGIDGVWFYVYLCLAYITPSLLAFIPQILSPISRWLSSIRNPCCNCLMQLIYPQHSLYVGHNTYAGPGRYILYTTFWVTMLAFKLWFSYQFQILPLIQPSFDIFAEATAQHPTGSKVVLLACIWIPVLFIYFIDLQIWYFCWYAIVGLLRGWSQHLGEIRGLTMLHDRFLSVPFMFNKKMLPTKPSTTPAAVSHSAPLVPPQVFYLANSKKQRREYWNNNEYWNKFALTWNEMIKALREDDFLSNREAELQRFRFAKERGELEVYLPIFITAGLIDKSIYNTMSCAKQAAACEQNMQGERLQRSVTSIEQTLHTKIGRNVLKMEALSETWESTRWLLTSLLGPYHQSDVDTIFSNLLGLVKARVLFLNLDLTNLGATKFAVLELARAIESALARCAPPDTQSPPPASLQNDLNGISKKLQSVFEVFGNIVSKASQVDTRNLLEEMRFARDGFFWKDEYAIQQLWAMKKDPRTESLLQRLSNLLTATKYDVEPRSVEARRRMRFFVNSMFMDMPQTPPVHECCSWSTLTPYYAETVLNTKKELLDANEDGVTMMYYLRTLYPDEWKNFKERTGASSETEMLADANKLLQLRMWASSRGQTLYRTVRGMMQYERALKLLCELQGLKSHEVNDIIRAKFGYIVSCQRYGAQKKAGEAQADDIELLLQLYA
jgi:callose synthase